jgi:hypothetical protein
MAFCSLEAVIGLVVVFVRAVNPSWAVALSAGPSNYFCVADIESVMGFTAASSSIGTPKVSLLFGTFLQMIL